MTGRTALFGIGLGGHTGAEIDGVPDALRAAANADRDGIDYFTVSDHPYHGNRLDAYATLGFILGTTTRISGVVDVTNLGARPAPMLARTVASLSVLSGGRILLGIGAGGLWDQIVKLGVPRRDPAAAVKSIEEAIILVRALCGGGESPVTFHGQAWTVDGLDPAPVKAPPVWTGSVGPKSLAVTGRLADGWIPGYAADWLSPRYRESRPVIDEAAASAGRDPSAIGTFYNFPGTITAGEFAATRDETGRWVGGSVRQWVDELTGAVLEHRAAGFTFFPAHEGDQAETVRARWAQEVVPAIREAIAKG
jgi:alkanesulfonate monooxygenase SsuD/methylene tetrahydromethanopterin reductase-like flavin-dependent oxidoreductase (luciferase family)